MGKNSEAPRQQGGASRHCNIIYIVPLNPASKAGLRGTVRPSVIERRNEYGGHR
jgi:hypothetical protein